MNAFLEWMNKTASPKLEKITNNVWIQALQSSIMKVLPMILVGSLVTLYNILRNFFEALPDLTPIRSYTFGLISIFIVFMVPYTVLELKKKNKNKYIAGFTGIALYMMMVNPTITDAGYVYDFSSFGAGGMFVAIIAGLITAIIMNLFANISIFGEDSVVPDFVKQWFDSMIPVTLVILVGWFFVIYLGLDLFTIIVNLFAPLNAISQTLPGMILLYFIPTLLYSMGISGWVFQPILNPLLLMAITANIDAVAQGGAAQFINSQETMYLFLSLGGRGTTLSLAIMMLFAKSKRLSSLSKATIVPSVLNINEPLVFGSIAWNPILMLPMWIIAIVLPTITYFAMSTGFVEIPAEVFNMWYMPAGIGAWLITSFKGVILVVINLAVSALIWYPFLAIYDKQEFEKEESEVI